MTSSADWGEPSTKTVTWHDPRVSAEAGLKLSGLAYMQAMADGRIPPPPIASTMGFQVAQVTDGDVRFTLTPDDSLYNPIGMVHGGVVCTLLDSVLGCAVHTTLPPLTGYTSIEIKVSYLRPVFGDSGELTAHGWVTKPGRRVAFAEGDVRTADGKVVATASGSLLIMAPPAS